MRKSLSVLAALVFSASAAAAYADPLPGSGAFSALGTDSFTSSSVTFDAPGYLSAQVAGDIEGFFTPYLSQGALISFPDGTTLPYTVGNNTPPPQFNGMVPIFSVSGNGETFTFEMTQYTAGYTQNNQTPTTGCNFGSTCLDVTGYGYFAESGLFNGDSGPASFTISSQYQQNQTSPTTTFSASAGASAVTPEPASLALLGTGLLGMIGIGRRKLSV